MTFLKRQFLILLLCNMTWLAAGAVPADEYWQPVTLSDGKVVELCLIGDEHERHYEDRHGTVYEQDGQGNWVVVDSEVSRRRIVRNRQNSRFARRQPGRINLAPRGIVILVNYADVSFEPSNDLAQMQEMLNGDHYTYEGATGSARQYFRDQSDGQYVPQFDVVGPVTLDKNRAYYGTNSGSSLDVNAAQMVIDACLKADQAGVDFSLYDNDKDGEIDFVFILFADKGEADGGSAECIWPHNWNVRTGAKKTCMVDGLYVNNYACCAEKNGRTDKRTGIGTFCHEFGHVIGLPDYYDTRSGTNYSNHLTPRYWNIMDLGNYLNGSKTPAGYSVYDKYYLGWLTPTNLGTAEQQVTLLPVNQPGYVTYQVTSSGSLVPARTEQKVYYIECRQKTGWDAYLPGHGMLVWQVNYSTSAWTSNTPNNTAYAPRFTLLSASGSTTGLSTANDPFPGEMEISEVQLMTNRRLTDIVEKDNTVRFIYNRAPKTYTLTATNRLSLDDHTTAKTPYYVVQGTFADVQGNAYKASVRIQSGSYAGSFAANAFLLDQTYVDTNGTRLTPTTVSGKVTISGQNLYQTDLLLTIDAYTVYRLIGEFEVVVPEPKLYTLQVTCTKGGSVALMADGYTTKNNTAAYQEGAIVQLLPVALSGWQFAVWKGNHASLISEQNGVYTLTIGQEDCSLTAVFERSSCTVKTLVTPAERGSVMLRLNGQAQGNIATVPYMTKLTAEATPVTDFVFTHWQDGETANPRTLTITGDTTLTACFTYVPPAPEIHTLTIEAGMGSILLRAFGQEDQTNSGTYTEGTIIVLQPQAPTGYRFAGWEGDDADAVQSDNGVYMLTLGKKDLRLTALWQPCQYSVTAVAGIAGQGTVSLIVNGSPIQNGDSVPYRTDVQLTATAAEHYHFEGWNDGMTDNPRTLTVVSDTLVTALFTYVVPEPRVCQVSVSGQAHGQVVLRAANTPDNINHGHYIEGTTLLLVPMPAVGYRFAGWTGDDAPQVILSNNTYTLHIEAKDYVLTALWEQITYPVSVSLSPQDKALVTVTADGETIALPAAIAHGTTVEALIEPIYGWSMTGWNDGETVNPRTLTVTQAVQLTALLQRNSYAVTSALTDAAAGTLSMQIGQANIENGQRVPFESNLTLAVTPAYGWELTAWSDGETANPRSLTVTSDTMVTAIMNRKTFVVNAMGQPADRGDVLITANGQLMESGTTIPYETSVSLYASPAARFHFTAWSDGETANPRTVTVIGDTAFYALFERDSVERIVLLENEEQAYYDELTEQIGAPVKMAILQRTFKPNTYSTLCLPFDVTDISQTDLCGSVFRFIKASGDAIKGMNLYFTFAEEIKAGVPYIVLTTDTIVNPFFQDVVLKTMTATTIKGAEVQYMGTLQPVKLVNAGPSVAFFSNNKLYHPTANGTFNVTAFKAYFYIPANAAGVMPHIQIIPSDDIPNE